MTIVAGNSIFGTDTITESGGGGGINPVPTAWVTIYDVFNQGNNQNFPVTPASSSTIWRITGRWESGVSSSNAVRMEINGDSTSGNYISERFRQRSGDGVQSNAAITSTTGNGTMTLYLTVLNDFPIATIHSSWNNNNTPESVFRGWRYEIPIANGLITNINLNGNGLFERILIEQNDGA